MKHSEFLSRAFFLCVSFSLIACITRPPGTGAAGMSAAAPRPERPAPDPWAFITEDRACILQNEVRPGYPVTVIFYPAGTGGAAAAGAAAASFRAALYPAAAAAGAGTAAGVAAAADVAAGAKKLSGAAFFACPLDESHAALAAVLSVPSTAPPGGAVIRIEKITAAKPEQTAVRAEIPLTILDRNFASEEIPLNAGNTALRTEPDPKKTAESARLWGILNTTGDTIYATGGFSPPVPAATRRTSFFGDRRVYVYSNGKRDTAIHAGIDYGVPTGTKVFAPADGRVALAGARMVTGNSIVLEHLPGLYTLYYHLDKIFVEEGALVTAGTLLAESGSTGLATGPHLHWEIRAGGENTDPDALCSAPLLDKTIITRKLLRRE